MSSKRFVVVVAVGALALILPGCGTRLPNSRFNQASGSGPVPGDQLAAGDTAGNTDTASTVAAGSSSGPGSGGGGGGQGTPGATTPAGGGGGGGGGGGNQQAQNSASDVGVTATSIKVGNITGLGGPLGPDAFGPTLRGMKVFMQSINARGGVNGRKLIPVYCDDSQDGSQNLACAQKLVSQDKIFAFVNNNSLATAPSARYEFDQGVPDLGYPLNNGYYKYPNFFSVYGSSFPRDGKQFGSKGLNYNTTEVFRYFKQVTGITKAAFFFYSESASQQQAYIFEQEAQAEGIQVAFESGGHSGENLAAPNFDTDVLTMKSRGVDGVFDAVDINGNQKICTSMDRYGVTVKAKASTIEVWSQDIGTPAWSRPCRNSIYIIGNSASYADTSIPAVAQYLADYKKYGNGYVQHQGALEGYANVQTFVDNVASMGAAPTRKGYIAWFNQFTKDQGWTDHGFFTPEGWKPHAHPEPSRACDNFVQWQDSAGTFVTRAPLETCYTTNEIPAPFTPDGS